MTGNTVLLVLDVQNGVVERLENSEAYLQRLAPVVEATRKAGIKIVYVTTGFRPGYPEAHPRNTSTAKAKAWQTFCEGDGSVDIHAAVAPKDDEPIITKRRVSAFTGTDLEIVLRSFGAERLVVTGLTTTGVVLSTVRQAADLDYQLTVLEDLCKDPNQEAHDVLMKSVLSKQATIMSSKEWLTGLQ